MSVEKRELYYVIETLPEELSSKVMDYIEYIKFSHVMTGDNVPEDLIVKNKEDLIKKLTEGEKDIKNGDVYSVKETFAELDKILVN